LGLNWQQFFPNFFLNNAIVGGPLSPGFLNPGNLFFPKFGSNNFWAKVGFNIWKGNGVSLFQGFTTFNPFQLFFQLFHIFLVLPGRPLFGLKGLQNL